MKQTILFLSIILSTAPLLAYDKPAYRLFKGDGTTADYRGMVTALAGNNIILFGEQHGNPIAHWLEYELARDLFALCSAGEKEFIMGGEFFDADTQHVINEFLQGHISSRSFEQEARPWSNYRRDYRPILNLREPEISLSLRPMCRNDTPRWCSTKAWILLTAFHYLQRSISPPSLWNMTHP